MVWGIMAGNMFEGRSASVDSSCPWTEVCASNTQLASMNKQHLDFVPEFDRSLVSVGRQIGEGGQGCIYDAKLHLPYSFKPVPVAVKKFKPFDGVSQGHFLLEMASAKCFNVCIPHGVFFDGDSLCMIMRRFSCDLRAAIDSRMKALQDEGFGTNGPPFSEGVGRSITLQLAMGLKALHECGVYHGDLKAANILLKTFSKNYESSLSMPLHLVIADFERSEGVVGTAFWRSPEVLRSLITRVPLSKEQWLLADVYSFGMVCYEVLTGMIPFDGHPRSDYDLVLNGGRPKLPDHVPKPMRDLIMRCWQVDPHSRPSWSDIIEVLKQHDDSFATVNTKSCNNNLVSVELLSIESLIHESKQLLQYLIAQHGRDSKRSNNEFLPYYWAFEFFATIEEYASKFEIGSFFESPLKCDVQEFFERAKLFSLLRHQLYGVSLDLLPFLNQLMERQLVVQKILPYRKLVGVLANITYKVGQELSKVESTKEFEVGTSCIRRLLFFHTLVRWVLWYEHAEDGAQREFMMKRLLPTHWSLDAMIEALLMFFCMIVNTYIYILAMITYEPILLGLQYGLYKAKGCSNILYRSSGERICRFQRVWTNCTRYMVVSITLSFSCVCLLTIYGWRGILGWILFPCIIIYTPYWRRPIMVG